MCFEKLALFNTLMSGCNYVFVSNNELLVNSREMKIEVEKNDGLMLKKYAHAEICFRSCVDYLNLYFDEKVEWRSAKSRALLTAAIIEYAKPFKKSYAADKIDQSIIPAEYTRLHDILIKSRDKYIAHIDKHGLEDPDREFHRIHVIKKGPKIDIDIESPRIPPNLIEPMKRLASKLKDKSYYYRQKYLKKYEKRMFRYKGNINWELKIENEFCGFIPVNQKELTNIEWG